MELLSSICVMFSLNSIWETFGMILFFVLDQKVTVKLKSFIIILLLISISNAILYETIPPVMFQIIYVLFSILVFRYFTNIPIINCVKSVLKYLGFIFVFEGLIMLFLLFVGIDLRDVTFKTTQLLYCLPFKFLEIIIIYYAKRKEEH